MSKDSKAASSAAKNSRRRKKRRTLDVSDSSSSDSDSEMESGTEQKVKAILVDDDVELTDDESNLVPTTNIENDMNVERLEDDTIDELNAIPFTKTDLTSRNDSNQRNKNGYSNDSADLKKVSEIIDADRKKISPINEASTTARKEEIDRKNEYLGLIFENYGEDINSLREAPDFTNKSLVILANVLKEGSTMFDVETLKTILDSK